MAKKETKKFNVLNAMYGDKVGKYDIMPYLIAVYKSTKKDRRPTTFEEAKEFIISNGRYQWWGRCEYEIIVADWPCQKNERKIDIFEQVMMNIDIITDIFMENVNLKN